MKINNNQGENIYSSDSIIPLIRPSASLDFTGKLLFAGYGYTDKDKGYDDFSGIELKDKIVLVMTGKPDNEISDNSQVFDDTVEGLKIMSIIGGGAKAVLLVYDPVSRFRDAYDSGLAGLISDAVTFKDQKQFSLPSQIIFITRNAADALLKATGSNLKQLRDRIISTGKPASVEVRDITVTVSTSIEKTEFTGSNVVGIVEGSDPF